LCVFIFFGSSLTSLTIKGIKHASKLNGNTFNTITEMSLWACVEKCQAKTECESINYDRFYRICELNLKPENATIQLQKVVKTIYSEKESWMIASGNLCNSDPCEENKTCAVHDDNVDCVFEECRGRPTIVNGSIYGNMNNIGAVIAVRCDYDFYQIGDNMLVCDESGQWKYGVEPKCVLPCSPPPMVYNNFIFDYAHIQTTERIYYVASTNISEISSLIILEGSRVTFKDACNDGEYATNVPISLCDSGYWSMPTTKCIVKCPFSLSYSFSNDECISLAQCKNGYADTFQRFKYKIALDNNYEELTNVSVSDCIDHCRSDPLCNSFDYCYYGQYCGFQKMCFLQRLNGLEDIEYASGSKWTYFQRNCK
jgi:hypothetical protein